MDWTSISFDWNHAKAFLVTAEEGSLSAAARAMHSTQPTVGRQVSALETELGVTLFERVPHGLVLTKSGLDLFEFARTMAQAASELSLKASGQSTNIEGSVSISAGELDAIYYLPPIIEKLKSTEPGIDIEVVVSNDVSDLKRREADIALRNFRPTQLDFIAKKLRDESIWLYGARTYIDNFFSKNPKRALSEIDLIGYEKSDSYLSLFKKKSIPVSFANIKATTHSYLMQMRLVKQDLGLAMIPEGIAEFEPELIKVFEDQGPLVNVPLWLVCHRELHTSLRVRRVFDFLSDALQR
jgi:DNA-binding transcriptional LysR family regulator